MEVSMRDVFSKEVIKCTLREFWIEERGKLLQIGIFMLIWQALLFSISRTGPFSVISIILWIPFVVGMSYLLAVSSEWWPDNNERG